MALLWSDMGALGPVASIWATPANRLMDRWMDRWKDGGMDAGC